eukprot:gene8776-10402_t
MVIGKYYFANATLGIDRQKVIANMGTIGTQELVLHKYQLVYMDEKDKTWIQGYPGLGSGASTGMQASGEGEDTLHLDAASETANETAVGLPQCHESEAHRAHVELEARAVPWNAFFQRRQKGS